MSASIGVCVPECPVDAIKPDTFASCTLVKPGLVDDDMISENIDLANSDDGFADVERIELPVRYTRHDILIQELTRVEHVSAP